MILLLSLREGVGAGGWFLLLSQAFDEQVRAGEKGAWNGEAGDPASEVLVDPLALTSRG